MNTAKLLLFLLLSTSTWAQVSSKDIHFYTLDHHLIKGRISYPSVRLNSSPAVILIHGSGAADLDHYFPGHLRMPGIRTSNDQEVRLFLQVRDAFLEAGFVVLQYSKRGYGKFPEDINWGPRGPIFDNPISVTGTYPNLVQDVHQALAFLRQQEGVDHSQIFLSGISEGTAIAMEVAAQDKNIAGLVLLSAVARNLRDSLYFQNVTRFLNVARTHIDTDRNLRLSEKELEQFDEQEFSFKHQEMDLDQNGSVTIAELEGLLIDNFNKTIKGMTTTDPFREYYRGKFAMNPTHMEAIPSLQGHVLLIQGEADVQCPLPEALLLAKELRNNSQLKFTFKSFPELGHGLSPNIGPNKLINTIGPIENEVLDYLSSWLKKL